MYKDQCCLYQVAVTIKLLPAILLLHLPELETARTNKETGRPINGARV
jgi:hypothetical protein